MSDSNYDNLLYEVRDGKAYVTLNRPEKLNALSRELQQDIHDAMWEADNDSRVHCVILAGAGRAFCAGYDLTAPKPEFGDFGRTGKSFDDDTWRMEAQQRRRMAIFDMHKPVIGKVHGYCIAGGSELATCCDLVYIAEDAQMDYPATRIGVPDMHFHTWFLGMRRAMEMMMTGDSITGVEAVAEGWANSCLLYTSPSPRDGLLSRMPSSA